MQSLSVAKVLASLSLVCFALATFIVVLTPSSTGYEISIYQVYNSYLWLLLSFGILAGITSLVVGAPTRSTLGFFPLALNNFLIVSLWVFRGYAVYGRFDTLGHVGYMKDIVDTGHFSNMNFYPVLHIFGAILSYTIHADILLIMKIVPMIFLGFYMLSIYLLSRTVTESWMQLVSVMMFSLPIFFGPELPMFLPRIESFLLIPFVFYLMLRIQARDQARRRVYIVLLFILSFLITYMHPLTALIIVLMLLSFTIPSKFLGMQALLSRRKNRVIENGQRLKSLFLRFEATAILVAFFSWMLNFSNLGDRIRIIVDWLVYQKGESQLELFTSLAAHLYLRDSIEVILRSLGQYVILIGLGIAASFELIIRTRSLVSSRLVMRILFLTLFLEFLAITGAFFVTGFSLEFNRGMIYVVLTAALLNGLHFAPQKLEFNRVRVRKLAIAIFIMILTSCAVVIAVFNIYPSPQTKSYNQQVTYSELRGWRWMIYHGDLALPIDDIRLNQLWFARAIMGTMGYLESFRPGSFPPDHFRYDPHADPTIHGDRYLVIGAISKAYYPAVLPDRQELWKFTESDFSMLLNSSALRIYENGEFEAYIIRIKA